MAKQKVNQKDSKAFTEECSAVLRAVSDAQYVIGGKWKLMIIISMARGNKRFTEIQKQVSGISARVLSGELKDLELNGLIVKKVETGYPVVIEYELLPYSRTLEEVVEAMTKWGMQHRQKIMSEGNLSSAKIDK